MVCEVEVAELLKPSFSGILGALFVVARARLV